MSPSPRRVVAAVIAGLLLVIPTASVAALTPMKPWPPAEVWSPSSMTIKLHEQQAARMTAELQEEVTNRCVPDGCYLKGLVVDTPFLQTINLSSRYDGKRVPI